MKKLGLTGSIATGKSTALAVFADLGVPTFSSDDAVHSIYEAEGVAAVAQLFPAVVHSGKVDRPALARAIVENPSALPALEAAIHPLVRARMRAFLEAAAATGAPLAVIDVPLLFETGFDYGLDAVLVVTVDPAIQRARALARPGMTVEKLDTILARQMPQAEKVKRADYVLDTSGPLEQTARKIAGIVSEMTAQP